MAAVTFSGANGIDRNTILNAVMAQESQPLTNLQNQQVNTQNKNAALVSLAGIITATEPAQFDALAPEVSADGGSISFTIGGQQPTQAITISAGTTLIQLKDQINNQNSGVSASVVNDGTGYKLIISSRQTGLSNGFTINNTLTNSGGTALAFAVGQSPSHGNAQDAQDAAFTVNGLGITSASNTVTDAIPGVTLNLLKAGGVQVTVASDYSSLKDNIKTLVGFMESSEPPSRFADLPGPRDSAPLRLDMRCWLAQMWSARQRLPGRWLRRPCSEAS